jgi:hypothetical protein
VGGGAAGGSAAAGGRGVSVMGSYLLDNDVNIFGIAAKVDIFLTPLV